MHLVPPWPKGGWVCNGQFYVFAINGLYVDKTGGECWVRCRAGRPTQPSPLITLNHTQARVNSPMVGTARNSHFFVGLAVMAALLTFIGGCSGKVNSKVAAMNDVNIK